MVILGIESTCDETAAAIVQDGRTVISNVISTSVKEQALYGGVVPEIASRRHIEYISPTVEKALADASMTMADVDAVAVTFAPGLIGAVLVGVNFAKGLAYASGKPLVPVHHQQKHIQIDYRFHCRPRPFLPNSACCFSVFRRARENAGNHVPRKKVFARRCWTDFAPIPAKKAPPRQTAGRGAKDI